MTAQAGELQNLGEYLTVGEAAVYLGVSPWTLRNWDKAGRLRPIRHPKNGYRIYRKEDLASVLKLDTAGTSPEMRAPRIDWRSIEDSSHFVQFYETDAYLVDSVAGYIGTTLMSNEGAIVVATEEHRHGIEQELKSRGLDVAAAQSKEQLILLDAQATIEQFLVNGIVDDQRFLDLVGATLRRARGRRRRVRAFGEMVALLWKAGNRAAAMRVEELWNQLGKQHPLTLFCAYPMDSFNDEGDAADFDSVCSCHSKVIPTESYIDLESPEQRLRAISMLQQKARVLEGEIERRKQIEQNLHEANRKTEQASKAKDEFLAVLSHELRTPLTPIMMAANALEHHRDLPADIRDDLSMIRRNIALETRLIDDLLDLSRVINGKMQLQKQDLEIHSLIQNVVAMVQADANAKHLTIQLDLKAAAPNIHGDSARLHQVVWNLLNNSIKFTPARGTITLRTRDNNNSSALLIEVEDTGVGIDPSVLTRIFNAFDQGDAGTRQIGGLGLGLAISKAIVDMHGGSIAAHSDGQSKGARFTIELPTQISDAAPIKQANASQSRPRSLRILLVDDHADTLRLLDRLLQLEGHQVTTACTVAQASSASSEPFDLLISDIGLPDGTGFDVLSHCQTLHPTIPAIALTGYSADQDVRQTHAAGFSTHLTKPIDVSQLRNAIADLLQ